MNQQLADLIRDVCSERHLELLANTGKGLHWSECTEIAAGVVESWIKNTLSEIVNPYASGVTVDEQHAWIDFDSGVAAVRSALGVEEKGT